PQLVLHPVEGGQHDAGLLLGDDAGPGQAPDMGAAAREIVARHPPAVADADGEREQLVRRPPLEAAVPQCAHWRAFGPPVSTRRCTARNALCCWFTRWRSPTWRRTPAPG